MYLDKSSIFYVENPIYYTFQKMTGNILNFDFARMFVDVEFIDKFKKIHPYTHNKLFIENYQQNVPGQK